MLAQRDLLRNLFGTKAYKTDFQLLPKELDAKVSKLRLPALRAELAANSSQIELVWGSRGFCGLRFTSVDWHCQSRMD